jgi:hypothetical protein
MSTLAARGQPFVGQSLHKARPRMSDLARKRQRTREGALHNGHGVPLNGCESATLLHERGDIEGADVLERLSVGCARHQRGHCDRRAAPAHREAHTHGLGPPRVELQAHPVAADRVLRLAAGLGDRRTRPPPRRPEFCVQSGRETCHRPKVRSCLYWRNSRGFKDLRAAAWAGRPGPREGRFAQMRFPRILPRSNDRTTRANQPRGWGAKPRAPRESPRGQPSYRNFRDGSEGRPDHAVSPYGNRGPSVETPFAAPSRCGPGEHAAVPLRAVRWREPALPDGAVTVWSTSERTLDHAPNEIPRASDFGLASEPAARPPRRPWFRAQGDVRRIQPTDVRPVRRGRDCGGTDAR